ncbi:MAG: hypothetical protein OEP48_05725 [Betaproteobacteria bacterium]|nr:hypothetical protein [Betaproteobacteria bacterium]MDH3437686.1 hypothetical protein [Betaproteobacteria bacterium]
MTIPVNIQKADPRARRRAAVVLIAGVVVGALLLLVFERYEDALRDWIASMPELGPARIRLAAVAMIILLIAPLLGLAVYFWRFGGAVIGAQRFPPPGCAVVRDTPVLAGQKALRRGRAFRMISVFLLVAAAMLSIALWRLAVALAGQGA